jgi:hypothetical protein
MSRRWIRNQIACYGAAIAIIVEQLNTAPSSAPPESPPPLIRLRERFADETGWHPDELIRRSCGRLDVLIWDSPESSARSDSFHRN